MAADISTNVRLVRQRVEEAAKRGGTDPAGVTLIAVTKNVPANRANAALACGIRNLGESRVQEARDKHPGVDPGATWHLVGHLQRNKVKDALDLFQMIHSLDRLSLAEELEKRAGAKGVQARCLVQVNVGQEASKSGLTPEEVPAFLEVMAGYRFVAVEGLMTIAPYAEDPEKVRPVFRSLRQLQRAHQGRWGLDLPYLSMGMTNDFEVALEEGANMVRVGTAIFGERDYGN